MSNDFQDRKDIDRLLDSVFGINHESLQLVRFKEGSNLKNISYTGDDSGTIDAILGHYRFFEIFGDFEQVSSDLEGTVRKDSLYKFKLWCSDYNPNVGDTVTVSVMVTNFSGALVKNYDFELVVDDNTIVPLVTDSNGTATYSYECSRYGLCRFSVESYSTFINVGNQKSDVDLKDYVKKEDVQMKVDLQDNGVISIGLDIGEGY